MLRPVGLLVLAAALIVGPAGAGAEARTGAGAGARIGAGPTSVVVDRVVTDPRITEASGLVESLIHPGVLWTHDDSGNPPLLFAVRADGGTAAAVRVAGVAGTDWEAIAAYRDGAGRPVLAVGDIGDNAAARTGIEIVLVAEPALADATVRPLRVLRLRYPAGPQDAETLLIDQDARRMYVVTKGLGGTVYEVPTAVWPGTGTDSGTLAAVATVPLLLVTDGVMVHGHPVLRTYGDLTVLPAITDDVRGGSLEPIVTARLPLQQQGEGLALAAGGNAVLLGSEGARQPILRMPLPAAVLQALVSGPRPRSRSAPSGAAPSGAAPSGAAAAGGVSRHGSTLPALLGVLAAVVGLGLLTSVLRGRTGRRMG